MTALSLRCLEWTAEGELDASDQLELLQTLLLGAQPDVQIELIYSIEATALRQPCASLEITPLTSF